MLEKQTVPREDRLHGGKVDGHALKPALEFACWNGEVIRLAFIIDAFDRGIIVWTTVANAGIYGSDVRDIMLEAVEKRFRATRVPHAIEHLSDHG